VTSIGGEHGASVDVQLDVAGTPLTARITRRSAAALRLAAGSPVVALIKSVAIDRDSVGYA
jgi:molybdate transport system ATP-binding protein